jgi:hypothetical protein
MPTLSPFLRRLRTTLGDGLLIGGLIVWLGVMIIGWFSLDRPDRKTDAQPDPPKSAGHFAPAKTPKPAALRSMNAAAHDTADDKPRPQPDTIAAPQTKPATTGHDSKPQPAAKPPQAAPSVATAPATTVSSSHVTRAQFTSGITAHEPVDRLQGVFHSQNQPLRHLYYFTDLSGLGGDTVTYHWRYDGRAIANVTFTVGSNSWRAYSSKRLTSAMAGRWTVVVTDDSKNQTLATASIVYKVP